MFARSYASATVAPYATPHGLLCFRIAAAAVSEELEDIEPIVEVGHVRLAGMLAA
jgi:hypothetical protein